MAKITRRQFQGTYKLGKQVWTNKTSKPDAQDALTSDYKMNSASASFYLSAVLSLLDGIVYKKTISRDAVQYFLEEVLTDFGKPGLKKALASVLLHIEYYEKQANTNQVSMRKLHKKITKKHLISQYTDFQKSLESEIISSNKLSQKERLAQIHNSNPKPEKVIVTSHFYKRNPHVIVEVLTSANGKCQGCKKGAPFTRKKDNTPYLEVHHKKPLSEGGDDTIENAIALCPNCHREAHFGVDSPKFLQ